MERKMAKRFLCPACLLFAAMLSAAHAVTPNCTEARDDAITCRDELAAPIRERLNADRGISDLDADLLQNDTIREYAIRATEKIVCDVAYTAKVDCLVDNLMWCPDILNDTNFTELLFGQVLAKNWDTFAEADSFCDAVQTAKCDVLQTKVAGCYPKMLEDEILSNKKPTTAYACKVEHRAELNCVVDASRECFKFLQDSNIIPQNLASVILEDRWISFNTGTHMCDCRRGRDCWTTMSSKIASATEDPALSSTDSRTQALRVLALGSTVCQNKEQIDCAYPQADKCPVFKNFEDDKDLIGSLYEIGSRSCDVLQSQAFTDNKDCIVGKIVDDFYPCISKRTMPDSVITKCSDLRAIYTCVVLALRGECNGDYTDTLYELLRGDMHKVKDCQVKGAASSPRAPLYTMAMLYALCVVVWALFI